MAKNGQPVPLMNKWIAQTISDEFRKEAERRVGKTFPQYVAMVYMEPQEKYYYIKIFVGGEKYVHLYVEMRGCLWYPASVNYPRYLMDPLVPFNEPKEKSDNSK